MTTQTNEGRIPTLTLGWRLKMALGEMSAQGMADHLGVSRQTLSRWMSDRGARPARAYLLQWAMATGVDATWLESGEGTPTPQPPTGTDDRATSSDALAKLTASKRARSGNAAIQQYPQRAA